MTEAQVGSDQRPGQQQPFGAARLTRAHWRDSPLAPPSKQKKRSLKASEQVSEGSTRARPVSLAGLLLLAGWGLLLAPSARASHGALSEVWSEADGLSVKYSTQHDDLLGARAGSELSLSSDKQEQGAPAAGQDQAEEEQQRAGADEPAESSKGGSAAKLVSLDEQPAEQAKDEEPEQGAGSSPRHTEKIPAGAGRLQFAGSRRSQPAPPTPRIPIRAGSGPEQPADEPAESNNDSDADEADDGPPPGRALGAKLRQAGRQFKQAVRLSPPPAPQSSSADDEASEAEEPEQAPVQRRPADSDPDSDSVAQVDENESSRFDGSDALAGRRGLTAPGRPVPEQADQDEQVQLLGQPGASAAAPDEQDPERNEEEMLAGMGPFGRPPGARELQAARASTLASPSKQEPRRQPELGHRQLSYFRNVHQQPATRPVPAAGQPRNANFHQPAGQPGRARPAAEPTEDTGSPDSVRDDFISPGHYPGSMPHLTQAASELAASKPSAAAGKSSQEAASETSATAAPAEPTPVGEPASQSIGKQEESHFLAVTPEPASQAQEQQIMAPILLSDTGASSTTTMAPMLASSSSVSNVNSTTSTSTTAAPEPLSRRFKARKYTR